MNFFIFIVVLAVSLGGPTWFFNTYRDRRTTCLQAEQKTVELTSQKTKLEGELKSITPSSEDSVEKSTVGEDLGKKISNLKAENETLQADLQKLRQEQSKLQREQNDVNALYQVVRNRSHGKSTKR